MNPRTANFAALYALWPGTAINPNKLEMFTMCPSPDAITCGRNAFVPLTTPQKSTSMIRSMSLNSVFSTSPLYAIPALLYTWFTRPKCATTSSA